MAEYQLFGDTDMTVVEYRNYFPRLQQPLQGISRERHVSISSSSAKSNTATNSVTDSNSDRLTSAALNTTTLTISAQLKTKIKQMRNGGPTTPVSGTNIRNLGNLNNCTFVNNGNIKLTLLELEFNVCFMFFTLIF